MLIERLLQAEWDPWGCDLIRNGLLFLEITEAGNAFTGDQVGAVSKLDIDEGGGAVAQRDDDLVSVVELPD